MASRTEPQRQRSEYLRAELPDLSHRHIRLQRVGSRDVHVASPDCFQSLILHWNGSVWARSAVQPVASDSRLYSITSIPDGQAWAVGYCDDGRGTMRQWLIWHFSAMSGISESHPPSSNYYLTSVDATGPSDVWALGGIWNSAGSQILALHF
jgi:hypothetical protein